MKTNLATTQNQSQRLLRCGVSTDTADMSWNKARAANRDGYSWMLFSENFLKPYNSDRCIPAWSLSNLLGLLPKEIDIDGYSYRISIYFENPEEPVIGNQWRLCYKPKKNTEKSHYIDDVPMYAPDLIECAVLMVEWLTRHNYKLNEQ